MDDIKNVSILDLVLSFSNCYSTECSSLVKLYPELEDVFYQSLEQSRIKDLNNQSTIIKMMIDDGHNTIYQEDKLFKDLDSVEQEKKTGFEY